MATKQVQDVPSHYHTIATLTAGWKAYTAAVQAHATRTVAARADSDEEEKDREVHATGVPRSQKGG